MSYSIQHCPYNSINEYKCYFRTSMCDYGKDCKYIEYCYFAHHKDEIKTPICYNYNLDKCNDSNCNYIHTLNLPYLSPKLASKIHNVLNNKAYFEQNKKRKREYDSDSSESRSRSRSPIRNNRRSNSLNRSRESNKDHNEKLREAERDFEVITKYTEKDILDIKNIYQTQLDDACKEQSRLMLECNQLKIQNQQYLQCLTDKDLECNQYKFQLQYINSLFQSKDPRIEFLLRNNIQSIQQQQYLQIQQIQQMQQQPEQIQKTQQIPILNQIQKSDLELPSPPPQSINQNEQKSKDYPRYQVPNPATQQHPQPQQPQKQQQNISQALNQPQMNSTQIKQQKYVHDMLKSLNLVLNQQKNPNQK